MNKNLPAASDKYEPQLPSPSTIYYKDFHFLDEPLINRPPKKSMNNDSSNN